MAQIDERTLVSFDWAMKSILRNKANFDVLEGFLCALLEENITIIAVLESEGNPEYVTDKFNRVDLQVRDSQGVEFIIEVQYSYSSSYLKRILFGAAKLITERIESGDDYQKVPKVISISLLYFPFSDPKEDKDYVYYGGTEFYGLSTAKRLSVRQNILRVPKRNKKDQSDGEDSEIEEVIDHEKSEDRSDYTVERPTIIHQEGNIFPEYYLIEVSRFPDEVKSALDEWIYFFKNSEIPEDFNAKNIQTARNKLGLIQMERKERRAFEHFQRARASYQDEVESNKQVAREEGLTEGVKQGIKQGIEQGIEQSRQDLARQMLANGEPVDKIALYSGLSEDEIRLLQYKLD